MLNFIYLPVLDVFVLKNIVCLCVQLKVINASVVTDMALMARHQTVFKLVMETLIRYVAVRGLIRSMWLIKIESVFCHMQVSNEISLVTFFD